MIYLSNAYFFPILQGMLFVLMLYAMLKDIVGRRNAGKGGVSLKVTRASETMTTLQRVAGLGIAAIITIVNKAVFDSDKHRSLPSIEIVQPDGRPRGASVF